MPSIRQPGSSVASLSINAPLTHSLGIAVEWVVGLPLSVGIEIKTFYGIIDFLCIELKANM
jgi:hypothetical protein